MDRNRDKRFGESLRYALLSNGASESRRKFLKGLSDLPINEAEIILEKENARMRLFLEKGKEQRLRKLKEFENKWNWEANRPAVNYLVKRLIESTKLNPFGDYSEMADIVLKELTTPFPKQKFYVSSEKDFALLREVAYSIRESGPIVKKATKQKPGILCYSDDFHQVWTFKNQKKRIVKVEWQFTELQGEIFEVFVSKSKPPLLKEFKIEEISRLCKGLSASSFSEIFRRVPSWADLFVQGSKRNYRKLNPMYANKGFVMIS